VTKVVTKIKMTFLPYSTTTVANPATSSSLVGTVKLDSLTTETVQKGLKKYTMNKHTDSVTYIDFKHENQLCASCGDDGHVYIFNYQSFRQEFDFKLDPVDTHPERVKICKFLPGTDILVSADLSGFLHFWCVSSTFHPLKGQRIVSV